MGLKIFYKTCKSFLGKLKERLFNSRYRMDIFAVVMILLTSVVLRVPMINQPPTMVHDESLFVAFVLNTVEGKPFFELHPPLGWLTFSLAASRAPVQDIIGSTYVNGTGVPFGTFPFIPARLISALFGLTIPVFIYLIARLLSLSVFESILPAILAVFEGGLIVHSRIMIPDSILMAFGFAGLFLLMFAVQKIDAKRLRVLAYILSGILFGMCVAVKWLGLGFLAGGLMFLFLKKRYKTMALVFVVAVVTYCFVLVMYFNIFNAGPVDLNRSLYKGGAVKSLVFPGEGKWLENVKFIIPYTLLSFNMHASSSEVWSLRRGSEPYRWPINSFSSNRPYWYDVKNPFGIPYPAIAFSSNSISWNTALFALIVLLVTTIFDLGRKKNLSVGPAFLISTYAINYVPFLFINYLAASPTFIPHYLPALCFSFLMIPFAVRRLVQNEEIKKWIYCIIIFGTIAVFFYLMPTIYGL